MFEKILKKIAIAFKNHNIPYIVIGGQAVLLYGEPRMTQDIDITLGYNIDRLDEILDVCRELDFVVLTKDVENFVSDTFVLPCVDTRTKTRIDFIFSFSDFERTAIQRANLVSIDNVEIAFVMLEDLIIFKIVANRERDFEDVRAILNLAKNLDVSLINASLKNLDRDLETDYFGKWQNLKDMFE